jgi:hypothetical protein
VKNVVNPLKLKGRYIYTIQKHTIKDMPKYKMCHKYLKIKTQVKQHRTKEHTKKILVLNLESLNRILIYIQSIKKKML